MTETITRMQAVERGLAAAIVARSQSLEQGAHESAALTAAVTGALLLLVLPETFILARSLVGPLHQATSGRAEDRGAGGVEARVAALSKATDASATLEVEPVSVHSTDEIGKVARAFDRVHGEAVRLAGNEALLRGSLSAMFINLSRRSVPLIDRLARMIDSLEQNEDDPDRLSSLFSMDHLVTRMRRNSREPSGARRGGAGAQVEQTGAAHRRGQRGIGGDRAVHQGGARRRARSRRLRAGGLRRRAPAGRDHRERHRHRRLLSAAAARCACLAASSAAAACCSRSRTTGSGSPRPGSRR